MGQTDFYELTYEEQAQFIVWIFSWFRTLEQAHFYYLQGYLDEEIWESQVKHLRQIIKTEGVKNWWDARRAFFNSTFQDLVDRAFEAALPGDDPRSVLKAIKKGTA